MNQVSKTVYNAAQNVAQQAANAVKDEAKHELEVVKAQTGFPVEQLPKNYSRSESVASIASNTPDVNAIRTSEDARLKELKERLANIKSGMQRQANEAMTARQQIAQEQGVYNQTLEKQLQPVDSSPVENVFQKAAKKLKGFRNAGQRVKGMQGGETRAARGKQ